MKTFYITDYADQNAMFSACFDSISTPKYANHTIYFHNFMGFDGILLFNHLLNGFDVRPIFRDNRIMSMKIKRVVDGRNITLTINDSMCLIPGSLGNIAKSFKVSTMKGNFPHLFAAKDKLNYVGDVPALSFYPPGSITADQHQDLVAKSTGA